MQAESSLAVMRMMPDEPWLERYMRCFIADIKPKKDASLEYSGRSRCVSMTCCSEFKANS